jgi:hypothetical protein
MFDIGSEIHLAFLGPSRMVGLHAAVIAFNVFVFRICLGAAG